MVISPATLDGARWGDAVKQISSASGRGGRSRSREGRGPIRSQQGGETRPGFEVLSRTKLFTGPFSTGGFRDHSYSVAGDAKSFLMFQPLVGPRQALVVTLNWFEQMKEPNPKP